MKLSFIFFFLFTLFSCRQQRSLAGNGPAFIRETYEESIQPPTDSVVTEDNLRVLSMLSFGEEGKEASADTLSNFIKIELISRELYESKRKSSVSYLIEDEAVKKHDSIMILPCRDSTVVITDHIVEDETHELYSYVGQIPTLNQYVVGGLYWETLDYVFIDKYSGKQTAVFGDVPFVSPDKKYIISIYANPYEPMSADFSLHRINNKKFEPILFASFRCWMPYMEGAFFSKDGWLYVPVNHPERYWNNTGNQNTEFQCVRIKAL